MQTQITIKKIMFIWDIIINLMLRQKCVLSLRFFFKDDALHIFIKTVYLQSGKKEGEHKVHHCTIRANNESECSICKRPSYNYGLQLSLHKLNWIAPEFNLKSPPITPRLYSSKVRVQYEQKCELMIARLNRYHILIIWAF